MDSFYIPLLLGIALLLVGTFFTYSISRNFFKYLKPKNKFIFSIFLFASIFFIFFLFPEVFNGILQFSFTKLIFLFFLILGFTLPFGLEFIISSILSFKLNFKFSFQIAIFSFVINFIMCFIFFNNGIFKYVFLFCINQVIGIKFGEWLREKKK